MRLCKKSIFAVLVMTTPMLTASLVAEERIDYRMIEQMRDEGFSRSQAVSYTHLTLPTSDLV